MTDQPTAPVTVTQRISAPAPAIFAVLTDPARHLEIDGSSMLREALTTDPVRAVGDEFRMAMWNPDMGDYEMTSRVVAFEPDRRIWWAPRMTAASRPEDQATIDQDPGHIWGYDLRPVADGVTEVTESYDSSKCPDFLREAVKGGELWRGPMTASLDKLAGLCAG